METSVLYHGADLGSKNEKWGLISWYCPKIFQNLYTCEASYSKVPLNFLSKNDIIYMSYLGKIVSLGAIWYTLKKTCPYMRALARATSPFFRLQSEKLKTQEIDYYINQ